MVLALVLLVEVLFAESESMELGSFNLILDEVESIECRKGEEGEEEEEGDKTAGISTSCWFLRGKNLRRKRAAS